MNGNIDKLNRKNGGQILEVEWWVAWDPNDRCATLDVTLEQGATRASDTVPLTAPTPAPSPATRYTLKTPIVNGGFTPGPATVEVAGTLEYRDGATPTNPSWTSPPLQVPSS